MYPINITGILIQSSHSCPVTGRYRQVSTWRVFGNETPWCCNPWWSILARGCNGNGSAWNDGNTYEYAHTHTHTDIYIYTYIYIHTLQTRKTSLTCPHWLRTSLTWSFEIALSDHISKSFWPLAVNTSATSLFWIYLERDLVHRDMHIVLWQTAFDIGNLQKDGNHLPVNACSLSVPGSFTGASRMLHGCFTGVSRVAHDTKSVFRVSNLPNFTNKGFARN